CSISRSLTARVCKGWLRDWDRKGFNGPKHFRTRKKPSAGVDPGCRGSSHPRHRSRGQPFVQRSAQKKDGTTRDCKREVTQFYRLISVGLCLTTGPARYGVKAFFAQNPGR